MSHQADQLASKNPLILIAAGGTGGHIFPGVAVAKVLKSKGYRVGWIGNPQAMEGKIVPRHGIDLYPVIFYGLRGKGLKNWLLLPFFLIRAFWQAFWLFRRLKPKVVLGMGGYVSFVPVWLAKWFGISTAIHEQNALAGQVNRILSSRVDRVFTHFQQTLLSEVVVGNPVRDEVEKMDSPSVRFKNRTGPLKILVLGGSLGAKALNDLLPEVLARIDSSVRPEVRHQSGEAHMSELRANYERYGVNAKCESFIDDVLEAMQETDLLISRSGATTVAEVSAIGVAALFVPFPFAVDDHQTKNAQFLVEKEAAWMTQQSELTADKLVDFLSRLNRDVLLSKASKAYELGHRDATQKLCTELESLIK